MWSTFRHVGPARARAFTLFELLLVLGILAMLAALAAPRYQTAIARYRVDAAARRLAGDLDLARTEARRTSTRQTVTLDLSNSSYCVGTVRRLDNRIGSYCVSLLDEPYRSELVTSPAPLGGSKTITFDIYGSPDVGGTIAISSSGFQKVVQVDSQTGQVTLLP